ncbi:MAG: nucleotidyl transferase AbiEii/AbiGii toxin family protein, partial [Pseudonocardiaceae bacterium]
MRRDEILEALAALGADLAERGLVADLYVVGGAAIALAYDERRATRDIDAVFAPKNEVYATAARVGAALDLPDGWLN